MYGIDLYSMRLVISIHALREESDRAGADPGRERRNFNPRPPRGERLTTEIANDVAR